MMSSAAELQISYRNTFIDADVLGAESMRARPLPRAASSPILSDFADMAEDILRNQDRRTRSYIGGLLNQAKKLVHPETSLSCDEKDAAPVATVVPPTGFDITGTQRESDEAAAATSAQLSHRSAILTAAFAMSDAKHLGDLNQGSRGHPFLCRRPCVHIVRSGSCANGDSCSYCHFPHEARSKLDNRQRAMCEAMPKKQFLSVLTEMLASQGTKIPGQGRDILSVLKKEMEDAEQYATQACDSEETEARPVVVKKFRKVISKMNFAALVSLASRRCTDKSKSCLFAILESLRATADF